MPHKLPKSVAVSPFKYWLSYIYPQLLVKLSSNYNPVLDVRLSKGRLRLDSGNSTYSYEDLYDTFYLPFRKLEISKRHLNRVLVLGGGLCSIPFMLQQYFNQNAIYEVVEIDDAVIQIARQFLLPEVLENINFHCTDAYDYVALDTQQYDLIAVDVFIDTNTPSKFRSLEFLENIKNRLSPDGLVVYNTMVNHEDLSRVSSVFYRSTFKQIFPEGFAIRTSGNRVLVYDKR